MNEKILSEVSRLRREQASKSLYAFAKIYMPHQISVQPSAAHLKLYELGKEMFEKRGRKLAIAAFREFGKSTMFTVVLVAYAICYAKEKFIILLSNTSSQSYATLDNVMAELTSNELFRTDFPDIFESEGRPKPPRWKEGEIITRNNIKVLALGHGQKIRGRRFGVDRPTLILLDDLEDVDTTFSRDKRDKLKKWLNKAVLHVGKSGWTNYIFLGNVFNSFSVLGEIVAQGKESGWQVEQFKAIIEWPRNMDLWQKCWEIYCKGDQALSAQPHDAARAYYSINKEKMEEGALLQWPQRWSLFDLMMSFFHDEGSFMAEMQSQPRDLTSLSWDETSLHYWNDRYKSIDEILENAGKDLELFGAADLCVGKNMAKGDYSAVVIVARKNNLYYIIEADISRKSPELVQEDIFAYCQRYKFKKFGIEANGFQTNIVRNVQRAAVAKGIRTEFVPINNTGDKIARLHSIYPWVKNGSVLFDRSDKLLIDECLSFPGGQHDDGIDALEMALRLAAQSRKGPQIDDVRNAVKRYQAYKMHLDGKVSGIEYLMRRVMRGKDDGLGGALSPV